MNILISAQYREDDKSVSQLCSFCHGKLHRGNLDQFSSNKKNFNCFKF